MTKRNWMIVDLMQLIMSFFILMQYAIKRMRLHTDCYYVEEFGPNITSIPPQLTA